MLRITTLAAALAVSTASMSACSDSSTSPQPSPLAGLVSSVARDSVGTPVPNSQSSTTTGMFRGTVLGQAAPGAGNDSLELMPRLSGVVVTAYAATNVEAPVPTLGDAVATVTTGADGKFVLSPLPGGTYVVTFSAPSGYAGQWVRATASATSGDPRWWVVLSRK